MSAADRTGRTGRCRARRMPASSAAGARSSTTSSCPACCTARSCAAPSRTPGSSSIDTVGGRGPPAGRGRVHRAGRWPGSRPGLDADALAGRAGRAGHRQGRASRAREVAFVVAEDRYSARDALELIDVEYEPLPAVVDAKQALDAGAPVIRDDLRGQDRQPHLRLGSGRQGGHGRGVSPPRTSWSARTCSTRARIRRRWRPAARWPTWTRSAGRLTVWSTSQAPHAHRTLYALVAGLPEHKIRVISPDIGGGFGNKVPIYPGYVCAVVGSDRDRQAGQVGGGPVGEPDVHRVRPRLPHARRDRRHRGRPDRWACGPTVLADHGAFNATAQPTKYPAGFFHIFTGSYDLRAGALPGDRASTRTRRPAGSPTRARSASPRRCTWSSGWSTCWPASSAWTRPSCG